MPRQFPLVGRDDTMAVLDSAVAAVARGTGGCVVVEGPAGIGKSRILATAMELAGARGVSVAAGRATELDRVAPLTTFLAALRGSAPPVLDESRLADLTRHQDAKFWLVDRLCEFVEGYCRDRCLVIALDDAQWLDELTSLALRMMVPALSSAPLLWLFARRHPAARSPADDTVDWLVGEGARRLSLGPLDPGVAAAFSANLLDARPGPNLLALVDGAGGNPFLLEELLTTLQSAGRIRRVDDLAEISGDRLPGSFVTAVDRRLTELPAGTRRLLEAGSVLGRPFTLHEVAGLLAQPAAELLDATRSAVESETLVDDAGRLWFRHSLIRDAVYDGLPGAARKALHRDAAAVLRAEGRPSPEVAAHFVSGAQHVGPQAMEILREALDEVAHSTPGAAADLILRTLDLLTEQDPARLRLIADAIRLLASAGRLAEAQRLGDIYLGCELPIPDAAAIQLGLAEALKHVGQNREVVGYTSRALDQQGVPTRDCANLLAVQAHALLQLDDLPAAQESAGRAIELGELSGNHPAIVSGGSAQSAVAYARGELDVALRHADDAVALTNRVHGEARHRHPRLWLGLALAALDQTEQAAEVFAADRRISEQLGTVWSHPLSYLFRADLLLATGQLADAEAEAEAGLLAAEQLGATACAPSLLATLAHLAVRRADQLAARRYLHRVRQYLDEGVSVTPEEVRWELALFQDAEGDPATAFETVKGIYPTLRGRPYLLVQEPLAAPHLTRLALQATARDEAETVAAAIRRLADRNPSVCSLAGAALHTEGLLGGDLDALRAAATAYRASPRPLCRASALEDLAVAEQSRGSSDAAAQSMELALSLYADAGARRDAKRARDRLRAMTSRRSSRRGSRRPKTGWDSLTQSELRVVRLVARGLTNREIGTQLFLSRHTVDSHVRHAFGKLQLSSRVELTRVVMTNSPDLDDSDN
ncbi:AAA family ATPase [Micromonospora sp. NPDC093277]|uniref:helix-turn-helix transcriptional regulator n=1 Tax=Micromonospora sp. NPDC093277 TaxID=3364291 RepID=UPI00381877FA